MYIVRYIPGNLVLKEIIHPKLKSLTHPYVIPKLNDFVSSVEDILPEGMI